MSVFQTLFLGVLLLSFTTFVAFFGRLPAFRLLFIAFRASSNVCEVRNTPISFLNRVIWVHFPSFLVALDRILLRGKIGPYLKQFGRKLIQDKHPVVMIMFLGLVTSGSSMILYQTWPFLTGFQKIMAVILVPTPYLFTYLCARRSPELHITPASHSQRLLDYPYDLTIFHPGNVCRTCRFEKPARSKHCSICKVCVARADHHCVWINNCVGRGNYRYFLLLMWCTGLLLLYGIYISHSILSPMVLNDPRWLKVPSAQNVDIDQQERPFFERTIGYALDWTNLAILNGGISIAGVGMICLFTAALPFGLFFYHTYLIWIGMTTNETAKWDDLKYDIRTLNIYRGNLRPGVVKWAVEPVTRRLERLDDIHRPGYLLKLWPFDPRFLVHSFPGDPNQNRNIHNSEYSTQAEPMNDNINSLVLQPWERVNDISDLENVYDIGFVDNVLDVCLH